MSEVPANRNSPKRARVTLAELAYVVVPPADRSLTRAYTEGEHDEAHQYARDHNTEVRPLGESA